MNICLVSHEYPPYISCGPGRYVTNLVNYLISKGNNVTVITLSIMGGKRYERKKNLEIIRLDVFQSKLFEKFAPVDVRLLMTLKLRKLFKKMDLSKFDVLHIVDKFNAYFLNKDVNIPVIVSVNDSYALESSWNIFKFPYFSTDILLRYLHFQLIKFLDKLYLKKADAIIVNSKYTLKKVNGLCKIPLDRIKLIYRGVKLRDFMAKPVENKYKSHVVLFVGKNMERKGAFYLLKAAPRVIEIYPDAKFVFIGKSNILYRGLMQGYVRRKGIRKNVKFIDYVPPGEIAKYYSRANVFCIPSVMEALGQVQLEAMAAGTPVIGTKVGGIPETITPETGLLVEPMNPGKIADAIIKIFSDPSLAKRMGENGCMRANKYFDAERMSRENLETYDSVVR